MEHIGSTSVPLRAKPILDIQVSVDEADRAQAIAALERLGYRHHGEGAVPGRSYLTSRRPDDVAVNVHVFARGSSVLEDNRRIRDHLRGHPDAARCYVAIKEEALRQGHRDLLGYSDAKRAFMARLRELARHPPGDR